MGDDRTEQDKKAARVSHRNIRGGESDPQLALVQAIADLNGVEVMEVAPLHDCLDDLVDQLFQSPPSAETNAELTFSYEGYRITVYQDGHTVFQPFD